MMRSIVADVLERVDIRSLDWEAKVFLAEGAYRSFDDEGRARELIEGVPQPRLVEYGSRTESAWDAFLHRFRLNRLLHVFSDLVSPEEEVVPDAPDPKDQAVSYFERAIVR